MASFLFILLLSYLLGSIPFSLVVGRVRGVDLRTHGSGNAGATNALRVMGTGPGLLVFLADCAKGFLATTVVSQIRLGGEPLPAFLGSDADIWVMVAAGAAAMLGHVVTLVGRVFFDSFRGGKGVATGAGMLLGLVPLAVGIALVLFTAVVWATRTVSLGSLVAAASIPLTLLVETLLGASVSTPVWVFAVVVPFVIIWTHRENVQRLLTGTENRFS